MKLYWFNLKHPKSGRLSWVGGWGDANREALAFPREGHRRLPVHHLTLLAHHPWTLDTTLNSYARRRAQYSLKHPLSAPGTIFPQHISFLILHHHPNCFNMSMKLASPAEGCYEYISLDLLVAPARWPKRWTRSTSRRRFGGYDECSPDVIKWLWVFST